MKKTRRTEKTVEIHEIYSIRTASGSLPALCGNCSTGDAVMLTPEQASVLAHIPTRAIYRLVETGAIHYREVPAGSLVVCLKTLVAASKPNDDNTPDASAPQCQPVKRLTQESGD